MKKLFKPSIIFYFLTFMFSAMIIYSAIQKYRELEFADTGYDGMFYGWVMLVILFYIIDLLNKNTDDDFDEKKSENKDKTKPSE